MKSDEQAIRDLVATWLDASKSGDTQTVLDLMTDDVIFLIAGQSPMRGKAAFAAAAGMQTPQQPFKLDGVSEIQEIQILGDWAYLWTRLSVTIVPTEGAAPIQRQGNTMSILKKQNGQWLMFRDANMLTVVAD